MAYTYEISTSKKDNKSFIGLQVCHGLSGIIGLFLSTFFVSAIYNPNDTIFEYVLKASQYEFFQYLTLFLFYNILSKFVDKTNRIITYRLSIIYRALLLLLVVVFGVNFSNQVILVGVLVGFGSALYYSSYNVIRQEMVNRKASKKFTILYNVFNQVVNIVVPIIMGALIDESTYSTTGIYVFAVSLIIIIASFFVKAKRPENSDFNLKDYLSSLKHNPKLYKQMKQVYFFCFLCGCRTITTTLLNVMVMVQFGTNFSFGAVSSLFSIVSIVTLILVGKYTKEGKRTWLYVVNAVFPTIGVLVYVFMPNVVTLFIYYFVFAISNIVTRARLDVVRNQNLKESGMYQYIAEHQGLVEISINGARVLTFGLMIVIAMLNNIVVYQIFFVVFSLATVINALYMLFYERRFLRKSNDENKME